MAQRDPAEARFYFIMFHRLIGTVLVVLGAMCIAGTLSWGSTIGMVLMVVGLLDFFVAPVLLARLWKSPGE